MNEIAKRSVIMTGAMRRIFACLAYLTALIVLLVPLHVYAVTVSTVHEHFDGITCTGPWQADPNGLNSSYYINCSNGWVAYALDNYSAGEIGSQNHVSIDTTADGPTPQNPPPASPASAEINTAPGVAPRGDLWFYKTFPVQPGVPIQTIQADIRIKLSGTTLQYYGFSVFDGVQTFKTGASPLLNTALYRDGNNTSSSDPCYQVTPGDWCAWEVTPNLGGQYIVPTSSYITVGFYISDTRTNQQLFGEVDNVTVSDVVTSVDSPLLPKDQAQLWSNSYVAPITDNTAEGVDAVTINGNTYVVGNVYGGAGTNQYDIGTIKYDDTGAKVWSSGGIRFYNGGNGDRAVAVADAGDGIYVVGMSYKLRNTSNFNDPSNNNDYVVIKYDYNGNQKWVVTYDNPLGGWDDVPTSVVSDGSGGVYITGSTCASPTSCDYLTVKINDNGTSGSVAWAQTYDGPSGSVDKAVGITLVGNYVYVTGRSTGSSDDIVTIQYDTAGTLQWDKRYDSGWNDRATAIATDSSGNSYITGITYSGGFPSILALKYDINGNLLWTAKYTNSSESLPSAMAIDSSGNVYISGKTGRVFDHDIVTLKINGSDGSIAWARTYGNPGFDDWGVDIGVSSSGSVYVLGALTRNAAGNTDIVTVKYDASGTPLSAITYDGSGLIDTPAALKLGVDTQGDTSVYVTGVSHDVNGVGEWVTIRYEKSAPDLTETSVSGPASAFIGNSITINDSVLNIDNLAAKQHGDSGPFAVGLYLAPGGSGAPDLNNLIFLGTRNISNLPPGNVNTANTMVTIPSHNPGTGAVVTEGTYYLVAVADKDGVVSEKSELNNIANSISTIAISGTLPDLAITNLSSDTTTITHSPTTTLHVTTTVTNLVSTPVSGSFRVGIYLSTDQTIDTSDYLIGYRTVNGLGSFDSDEATTGIIFDSTHNASIPPNTYYLGAIADDQGDVQETKENNNTAILNNASSMSALLISDKDFIPGLNEPGSSHAQVSGNGNDAHVMIEEQSAVWSRQSAWDIPDIGGRAAPLLTDLDGDGLPDLLVGSSIGTTYGYHNTGAVGNPVWTAMSAWNIPPPSSCSGGLVGATGQKRSKPTIGDMNGDGIPDILLIGFDQGICAYKNNGNTVPPTWVQNSAWDVPNVANPSTTPPNVVPPSLAGTHNAPTLADVNGDGLLDLFVGQDTTGAVYAYKNTGTQSAPIWSYHSAWNYSTALQYTSPRLVDFNHDGRIDYMMIGDVNGNVAAIKNNGTLGSDPIWAASSDSAWAFTSFGNSYARPTFGDIDGDGLIDMLLGGYSGQSFGLRNTGSFYANAVAPAYDGTYLSPVINTGTHGQFTTLSYVTSLPAGTSISVDIRSSTDGSTFSSWYPGIQPDGDISSLGSDQYIQYRINMSTSNGNVSPALYSIDANSLPAPGTPNAVSVVVGASSSSSGGGEISLYELMLLILAIGLCGRRRWRNSPYI